MITDDDLNESYRARRESLKAKITAEIDEQHSLGKLRTELEWETVKRLVNTLYPNELRAEARSSQGPIDVHQMIAARLQVLNAPRD